MLKTLLIAAVAAFCLARPGSVVAHGKHKAKLGCALASDPQKKLPIKGRVVRLGEQVKCTISTSATEPHKASVQTSWEDEGKKTGQKHDGEVKAGKPLEISLDVDKDFTECVEFVIDAALLDEAGKVIWKKKIVQRQDCPD